MSFKSLHNYRELLYPEVFSEVARVNPDYPFCFTLDADIPDASFHIKTYEQFLKDVQKTANSLRKYIPPREPGSEIHNVSVLANSNYTYAVYFLACMSNSWSVSVLLPFESSSQLIGSIRSQLYSQ